MNATTLKKLVADIAQRPAYTAQFYHSFVPVLQGILDHNAEPLKVVEWGPGKNTETFLASQNVTKVISYESDEEWYNLFRNQFQGNPERLDLKHIPFPVHKPVTLDIVQKFYDPMHPYVRDPLEQYGEDSFDIAFVDGGGFRTDCAEISQLLVKDGGIIVWHDILSFRKNNPEFPSGRSYQEVFTNFKEYHYFDRHRTLMAVNRKKSAQFNGDQFLTTKLHALKTVFSEFMNAKLNYVVLRNAGAMPVLSSVENDIDVLVHPQDMEKAHAIFKAMGFEHGRDGAAPGSMLYGARPHDHYYIRNLDIHIDVVQGLYYTSPNSGEKVAICRSLQESIFARRQMVGDFWGYVPHPNDQFLHLFCHALYDKKKISHEYKILMEELFGLTDIALLKREMEAIVFKFAPKALEVIEAKRAEQVADLYLSFDQY